MTSITDPERMSSHALLKMSLSTFSKSLPYSTSSRKTWTIYTRWLDIHRQNPSKFTENWSQIIMVWIQSLNARGFKEQEIRDEVRKWKEREFPNGRAARGERSLPRHQDITSAFDDKERQQRLQQDRYRRHEARVRQELRRYDDRSRGSPNNYRPESSLSEAPETPPRRSEISTSLVVSKQPRKKWIEEFDQPPPGNYVCNRCDNPGHHLQHCPTNMDPSYDRPPPQEYQCELCKVFGAHWRSLCPINIDPLSIIQKRKAAGITTPTKSSSRRQERFDSEIRRISTSRELFSRTSNMKTRFDNEIDQNNHSYRLFTRESSMSRDRDEKHDRDSVSTNRVNCQHCNSYDHRSESCPALSKNSFSTYRSSHKDAKYGRLSRFSDSYDENLISPSPISAEPSKKADILVKLQKIEEKKERVFNGDDFTMCLDSLVTDLSVQSFKNDRKRARSPSPAHTIKIDLSMSAVSIPFEHVHKKTRAEIGVETPSRCQSFFQDLGQDNREFISEYRVDDPSNSDPKLGAAPCQTTKFVAAPQQHSGQCLYVNMDCEDMEVEYDETEGLYYNVEEKYFIVKDHSDMAVEHGGYDGSENLLGNGIKKIGIVGFGEKAVNRRHSAVSILGSIPEENEHCSDIFSNNAVDRYTSTEVTQDFTPETSQYGFDGFDGAVDHRISTEAIQNSEPAEKQGVGGDLEMEDIGFDVIVPSIEREYCSTVKQLREERPEVSEVVNSPKRMTATTMWNEGATVAKDSKKAVPAV